MGWQVKIHLNISHPSVACAVGPKCEQDFDDRAQFWRKKSLTVQICSDKNYSKFNTFLTLGIKITEISFLKGFPIISSVCPTSLNFFSFDFVEFFYFIKLIQVLKPGQVLGDHKTRGLITRVCPLLKYGKMFHGVHKIWNQAMFSQIPKKLCSVTTLASLWCIHTWC